VKGRFTAGELDIPKDPVVENATDGFELGWKLASRAEIIARRRGITKEEAEAVIQAIDAETPARPNVTGLAGAILNRPPPGPIVGG
jgi:hypothetical protein